MVETKNPLFHFPLRQWADHVANNYWRFSSCVLFIVARLSFETRTRQGPTFMLSRSGLKRPQVAGEPYYVSAESTHLQYMRSIYSALVRKQKHSIFISLTRFQYKLTEADGVVAGFIVRLRQDRLLPPCQTPRLLRCCPFRHLRFGLKHLRPRYVGMFSIMFVRNR